MMYFPQSTLTSLNVSSARENAPEVVCTHLYSIKRLNQAESTRKVRFGYTHNITRLNVICFIYLEPSNERVYRAMARQDYMCEISGLISELIS